MRLIDVDALNRKDVNCANVPMNFIDTAPTVEAIPMVDVIGLFNKIRLEIFEEKEHAYADFEQYKVDYLGQDREDVYDSLPNDDFRYGMERCIEIINKHKIVLESEG